MLEIPEQRLIDQRANQLAGYPLSDKLPLENIRPDAPTVVLLLQHIGLLNNQLKQLKGETNTTSQAPSTKNSI